MPGRGRCTRASASSSSLDFADIKNSLCPGPGHPGLRRRVPPRVRGRGPVGASGHRRARLPDLAARRLPLAARRHRLRRSAAGRARLPARRTMNFDLSDEHELIRERCASSPSSGSPRVAEELDREHRFPYELVAELAELGLMGIPIPEEYGGAGGDTLSYAIAIEELTRIDSSVAITVAAHTSLGTMPIFLFGSEEQKREWLPDLAAGRKLAAFGLTEPGAGSDAGATQTRPSSRDGQWVVERLEDLHHQRRHGHHRLRDDHRPHRRGRDLEHRRPERHAGLRDLGADAEAGLARLRHARARRSRTAPSRRATCSASAAAASRSSSRSSTAAGSRSRRWASASRRARTTSRSPTRRSGDQFGRPIADVPGDPVPARRHGHRDRGRPRSSSTRPRG